MTRKTNLPCVDCGINTADINDGQWEFYMVTDETWRAAGPPPETLGSTTDVDLFGPVPARPAPYFLCIGCLEARLGRTLTPGDFTDCLVNDPKKGRITPRLRSRLTGDAA